VNIHRVAVILLKIMKQRIMS